MDPRAHDDDDDDTQSDVIVLNGPPAGKRARLSPQADVSAAEAAQSAREAAQMRTFESIVRMGRLPARDGSESCDDDDDEGDEENSPAAAMIVIDSTQSSSEPATPARLPAVHAAAAATAPAKTVSGVARSARKESPVLTSQSGVRAAAAAVTPVGAHSVARLKRQASTEKRSARSARAADTPAQMRADAAAIAAMLQRGMMPSRSLRSPSPPAVVPAAASAAAAPAAAAARARAGIPAAVASAAVTPAAASSSAEVYVPHSPVSPAAGAVPGLLERLLPAFDKAVVTAANSAAAAAAPSSHTPRKQANVVSQQQVSSAASSAVPAAVAPASAARNAPVSSAAARRPLGFGSPLSIASLVSPRKRVLNASPLPSIDARAAENEPGSPAAAELQHISVRRPQRQLHFNVASPSAASSRTAAAAASSTARPAPAGCALVHPAFSRLRAFHSRCQWLQSLMALSLFEEEFAAWGSVFSLAIELGQHLQRQRLEARAAGAAMREASELARFLDEQEDAWEEEPGRAAVAAPTPRSGNGPVRAKNTGRGLEEYVIMLLQLRGYTRTALKAGPRDGGIDVLATRELSVPDAPSSTRTDMVAVQCKEYYSDAASFYNGTVTTEEVRAFHSSIVGLEFFNVQRMHHARAAGAADAATPPLLADVRCTSMAYLITTGTFAQQARDFVAAFNTCQQRKYPVGVGSAGDEPGVDPPYRGQLQLIDGAELARWIEEADKHDPQALPRLELLRACELLSAYRGSLWQHACRNCSFPIAAPASWPWSHADLDAIAAASLPAADME